MADNKYFEIPKASVRKIMKLNDEVSNVSGVSFDRMNHVFICNFITFNFAQDAVSVTTKATELFIADFAECCQQIAVANKRKTIKVGFIFIFLLLLYYITIIDIVCTGR